MNGVRTTLFATLTSLLFAPAALAERKTILSDDLIDKVRGGWVGQMIGVSYGAPTEFAYLNRIIPNDELPVWNADSVREALNQDDMYVDITFAAALDEHGLDATTADFAAMFRDTEFSLWHANLAARRALRRGVPGELSGTPKYNIHANDIDFQIEADFIGLMSPGLPQESNAIGLKAGRVMNYGDGIYGGLFISGMYAAAFFEDDPREIVKAGLAVLPEDSDYAKTISDLLTWYEENDKDWRYSWQRLDDKWNGNEVCPAGAEHPFNIDAKLNGAYVGLGLLYGARNFEQTLVIATQAGQDSDCNPSSAAGILGVVLGYAGIPTRYTSGIAAIADHKFNYTDYSLNDIVDSSVARAIAQIERTGGAVEDNVIVVESQTPRQAELEAWNDFGSVRDDIQFDDARWAWSGDWIRTTTRIWRNDRESNISSARGATAEVSFNGTGASIMGILLPDGGQAEVYLDGELSGIIDVYPDEPNPKARESIWHRFNLEEGRHELKLIVLGEPYGESTGAKISISRLLVFE